VICPYLQSGQLEMLLEEWSVDPLPLHVVYPQNRHLSAKVRVFVEWIAELFADHPAMHVRAGQCPHTLASIRTSSENTVERQRPSAGEQQAAVVA